MITGAWGNDERANAGAESREARCRLALLSLPLHLLMSLEASRDLAALLLVLIAGVYVGFAVMDGRMSILATEGAMALGFVGMTGAALWLTPWVVPIGYVARGFWDIAHHRGIDTALPRWYPPLCAAFDWAFAVGLALIWISKSN